MKALRDGLAAGAVALVAILLFAGALWGLHEVLVRAAYFVGLGHREVLYETDFSFTNFICWPIAALSLVVGVVAATMPPSARPWRRS